MTMAEFDDYGTELDFQDFADWYRQVVEQEDGRGEQEPWWFAPVDIEAARLADVARRG